MPALRKIISVSFLASVFLFAAVSAWGFTLEISPLSQNVSVGQQATVDVWLKGLTAGETIGTYDITVNFDSSRFAYQSYMIGNGLGNLTGDSIIYNSTIPPGTVEVAEVSYLNGTDLSALQPGPNLKLFSLNFLANASGKSGFTFTSILMGDASGNDAPPASVVNGSATVVPIPSTLLLLGGGLGWVGYLRRRLS